MSTGKFTESDLENGALLPFFTQSTEHGGLGWMQGTDSMVDKARCVVFATLADRAGRFARGIVGTHPIPDRHDRRLTRIICSRDATRESG